jgi:hypothetical protein
LAESSATSSGRCTPQSTHTCRWRFSGRLTGVPCKPPFAEFVEIHRIRCKRSSPDSCRRFGKTAAEWPQFKTVTVRYRPVAARHAQGKRTFRDFAIWSRAVSHRITSSGRSDTDSGIVSPRALAVFRFTTSWNLVGCSISRSPGLRPSGSYPPTRSALPFDGLQQASVNKALESSLDHLVGAHHD